MVCLNKGQSAVEYLTTYGWMLLVVAIVGGAIFSMVQNSSQVQTTSGLANADVQVADFGVTESGFQAELRAGTSDQIENVNFTLIDPETGETVSQETNAVPVGDTETVSLDNVESSESTNTYELKIQYDSGGLEDLEETGSITAQIAINKSSGSSDSNFEGSNTIIYRTEGDYSDRDYSSFSYSDPVANPDVDNIKNGTPAGELIEEDVSSYDKATIQYLDGAGPNIGSSNNQGGRVKDLILDLSTVETLYLWVASQPEGRYDGGSGTGSYKDGAGSTEVALISSDSSDGPAQQFLAAAGGASAAVGGTPDLGSTYGGGARNGSGLYTGAAASTESGGGSGPPAGGDAYNGVGGAAVDGFAGNVDNSTISRTDLMTKGSEFEIMEGNGSYIDGEIRIKYE